MNGECTIVVGIGQKCVACMDVQCEVCQPLTMYSVPVGGSGTSGFSKMDVSGVFAGSAWTGVLSWRAASVSSSMSSSPGGTGVSPCGGVLVDMVSS